MPLIAQKKKNRKHVEVTQTASNRRRGGGRRWTELWQDDHGAHEKPWAEVGWAHWARHSPPQWPEEQGAAVARRQRRDPALGDHSSASAWPAWSWRGGRDAWSWSLLSPPGGAHAPPLSLPVRLAAGSWPLPSLQTVSDPWHCFFWKRKEELQNMRMEPATNNPCLPVKVFPLTETKCGMETIFTRSYLKYCITKETPFKKHCFVLLVNMTSQRHQNSTDSV